MPKLSVGALTTAQITQRTAPIVISGQEAPTPPSPSETYFLITNNNDLLVTDTNDNLTYGT